MQRLTCRRRSKICWTLLVLLLISTGSGNAQAPKQNDIDYALSLLEANRVDLEPGLVKRVLRDEFETIIWASVQYSGLPVFYHDVGYVFDSDGKLSRQPGSDTALLLGRPLPPPSAFPVDHRPNISESQAFGAFRDRVSQVDQLGNLLKTDTALQATLGFYNLNLGTERPPEYRLVWKVVRGGSLIELNGVSDSRQAKPLPGTLSFDAGSGSLRETVPGEAEPCEYRRAGSSTKP
jgi:hypothetical protein